MPPHSHTRKAAEPNPQTSQHHKGARPMSRKKILLVDDSHTILMMEKFILKNGPYDLVTAMDGEEAVRKATEHLPDLILLDVIMPRMGGFDACRLIRNNEQTRDIPIIMVTTRGEAANVETGWANGCTDYVTKPINTIELLSKVRSFLGENDGVQS
jgi:CheY-like chemotaxis protein